MDFRDYSLQDPVLIGSTENPYAVTMTQVGSHYFFLRVTNSNVILEKWELEGTSAVGSVNMRNHDNTGDLVPANDLVVEQVSSHLIAIPGTNRVMIVYGDQSGTNSTTLNVWNDDLTLHQTFLLANRSYLNQVDVDDNGNFFVLCFTNNMNEPFLFYYDAGETTKTWEETIYNSVGTVEYEVGKAKFLSNGNIVVATVTRIDAGDSPDGDGRVKFSIWNPSTESQVVAPTYHPVTDVIQDDQFALEVVAYDGYFALFWIAGDQRYASWYRNDGTLQTQTQYNQADYSSEQIQATRTVISGLVSTAPNNPLISIYQTEAPMVESDRFYHLNLVIHDPNNFESSGALQEDTYRISSVGDNLTSPKIFPLPDGDFMLMYYRETGGNNLYYQKFTYEPLPARMRTWDWSWKYGSHLRRQNHTRIPTYLYPGIPFWANRRS